MKDYDVIITGAGPAGMMAAITAQNNGARTLVLEKMPQGGRKLLITGNGRCNLTFYQPDLEKFVYVYGKNGPFLWPALLNFGIDSVLNFFKDNGLPIIIQPDGRVFPHTDSAGDVLKTLDICMKKSGVKTITHAGVEDFILENNRIEGVLTKEGRFSARNYIICTGGQSYPETGSTGDGYKWAKKMGHKIVPPAPGLVPMKIRDEFIRNLQGISLCNAGIRLYLNQREICSDCGDLVFTHFGISGPAVLNMSRFVESMKKSDDVKIVLDLLPDKNENEIERILDKSFRKNRNRKLKNCLGAVLPPGMSEPVIEKAGVDPDKKVNHINKNEKSGLIAMIKNLPMEFGGLAGFSKAVITRGGIDLRQIEPRSMNSKIVENLYFAGEIMDLDGPTGGYNLQICWSTGFSAGQAASSVI